ncbi:hypothetical protein HP572_13085 [Pectobacterium sp. PL64]|uniref:hypothetical protein n=1 Tax=Pectobacterium sp. PL64 TaxID=2738983 RepID=UPI001F0B8F0A|nr:hypothetical protein [Pectobacterium sp. PL64]UMO86328.1 hypothetical protein HP572_13085 [Pectobacterium sp. PL64]
MDIRQLFATVEKITNPLKDLSIVPPEQVTNDTYYSQIFALRQLITSIDSLQKEIGITTANTLLSPLWYLKDKLGRQIQIQYLTIEKVKSLNQELPVDSFYSEKSKALRWIIEILLGWNSIKNRFNASINDLPIGDAEKVISLDANTALNQIPINLGGGSEFEKLDIPPPPKDLPPGSEPKGIIGEGLDWYEGLNPKPGIIFKDGGAIFTLDYSCDWLGGGS